jgi:hypothetical protein
LNSFANAIDATKYGAEIKGIMCAPITGKANFTETVANALSKLRAEAPVFAHDKEAYSACLLLVAFSSDISGSLILSVAVVAMLCGFGGFNLDEIMENLGQPGFSRIMPQAQELFSAGAAFPTEINSLIKDTGFEGIEWNQPVLDVFGQWLDKNTKPYQDLGNQFLEEVNNIVAIPSIAADKISNVLTDMANKNDNPQNALASGVDKGTKDPKKIPPFDHWFSILSLAALLGQFNDVLKLGAEAGASLLKEADNLLGTAEKMADAPLAVIQNLQKISADVENINDTRLKVMGGAVELIKQLTSGISSPQFGALMVPLVKGGTEKLRQVLNEMVLNDPNAPEELNAPYGIIFPVMIVGSSTLQAPVELFYKALVSMFNITEITKP